MIQLFFQLLFLAVYIYLAAGTVYLLLLATAGFLSKGTRYPGHTARKKIAVLIPAYKEDTIIIDTATRAAAHNYPGALFQVLVIADSLSKDTLEKLRNLPVQLLEVQFKISTKARSIHAALNVLAKEDADIVVILDADNLMDVNCLEIINGAFHHGCRAVQCHRVAKNEDSPIALLGAISEAININLFRRGPTALGLSAAPLGSGMAFEYSIIKDIFGAADILDNPAEDREIEIQLMKRQIGFPFLENAHVFDEKVTNTTHFEKQRIRWLEAQMNHILRFYKPDGKAMPRTPVFYHIFFQNLLLPRLLYLFAACCVILMIIVQWLFRLTFIFPAYPWWLSWVAAYFSVLLISVPARFYSKKTLKAIAIIPVLIVSMLKAVMKLKRDRKEFLHTTKGFTSR